MRQAASIAVWLGLIVGAWQMAPDARGQAGNSAVSGNGKYRFRVAYTSSHLPEEAQKVLKAAHGGFAIDRRAGKGEVYFALPGAGIIQISSDLKKTQMLPTDPAMRDTNMHNAMFWQAADGAAFLTFPGNGVGKVFTTGLDGKLIHTLGAPDGKTDMGHPVATDYYAGRGNFIPTDVEQLDGMFYIPTGYSNLDFVLTAKILSTNPFKAEWHDLAFGGRGTGAGQFGTGHGITVPPGTKRIDVSDRPNSEIDRFTRFGQYLGTLRMPLGSFPCDIAYLDQYAVVGSLHGPDRSKGAPIYLLENDQLVSTIMPKEDLGLANFQHIHNATIKKMNGKLYIIAQAWNPGDFAILEQVQ
ncbi:MAG: hypothetical protein K7J46_06970 [Bryobacter sp.]|jgi:hypothetical protein|nr:hypothetical protein [Bryobacter sp. CoA8 C33]